MRRENVCQVVQRPLLYRRFVHGDQRVRRHGSPRIAIDYLLLLERLSGLELQRIGELAVVLLDEFLSLGRREQVQAHEPLENE